MKNQTKPKVRLLNGIAMKQANYEVNSQLQGEYLGTLLIPTCSHCPDLVKIPVLSQIKPHIPRLVVCIPSTLFKLKKKEENTKTVCDGLNMFSTANNIYLEKAFNILLITDR